MGFAQRKIGGTKISFQQAKLIASADSNWIMEKRMKKITLVLTIFLLSVISNFAQTSGAKTAAQTTKDKAKYNALLARREKFDPLRNSATDLQTTIAKAKKEHKRIVLDVGGEWCIWCVRMDVFLMQNPALEKIQKKNYIWLKINMSEENENKPFLSAYPAATGYPHLYVLETDGTLLKSKNTSELEAGKSYDLQKFTDFLNEYASAKK